MSIKRYQRKYLLIKQRLLVHHSSWEVDYWFSFKRGYRMNLSRERDKLRQQLYIDLLTNKKIKLKRRGDKGNAILKRRLLELLYKIINDSIHEKSSKS